MNNNLLDSEEDIKIKLCPEDICERASILYFQGFGFPGPNDLIDDKFTLAVIDEDIDINLSILRMATGSNNLEIEKYGNRNFVTIYWYEYPLIEDVLNIVLNLGIKFRTTNKFKTEFIPNLDKEYSKRIEEIKFIKKYYKLIDELDLDYSEGFYMLCNDGDPAFLSEWNWMTEEGKNFSNDLRYYLNKPAIDLNSDENYLRSNLFSGCDINTLESLESFESKTNTKTSSSCNDSEDEKCVICFERYPETIVVPCGHCVVCYICSEELKESNHRDKCIICRGNITKIIDIKDDQAKKTNNHLIFKPS